jgi:hypothetical protein
MSVLGSWFLVLCSWFLVLGSWFLVLGSWFFVFKLRTSNFKLQTANCQLPTANCQLLSSIFRNAILLDWSHAIQEPEKTLMISPSNPTEQEKQWIAAWRSAGPELERIRNEELRALTEEQGTLKATLLGVFEKQPLSESSGLLEFQKWMILWRKKLGQVK